MGDRGLVDVESTDVETKVSSEDGSKEAHSETTKESE